MQIAENTITNPGKKISCISSKIKKCAGISMSEKALSNYSRSFVSNCLDPNEHSGTKFNVKGFFLDSSVDEKIKSVPIFVFSLQRRDARETYISCFYAESYPRLFEYFNGERYH